jgi:hypothetical protein
MAASWPPSEHYIVKPSGRLIEMRDLPPVVERIWNGAYVLRYLEGCKASSWNPREADVQLFYQLFGFDIRNHFEPVSNTVLWRSIRSFQDGTLPKLIMLLKLASCCKGNFALPDEDYEMEYEVIHVLKSSGTRFLSAEVRARNPELWEENLPHIQAKWPLLVAALSSLFPSTTLKKHLREISTLDEVDSLVDKAREMYHHVSDLKPIVERCSESVVFFSD